MATTTFANSSTENRAVWKEIQDSLSLIMHAHECSKRVQQLTHGNDNHQTSSENLCAVAQCASMRRLLLHMTQCYDRQNCSVRECSVYRSVIFHWRSCTELQCEICRPLRKTSEVKWIFNRLLREFQVSDRPLTPDQLARIKKHAETIETDAFDTAKSLADYSKHAINRVVEIQKTCAVRRLLKKQEILAATSVPPDEHVSSNDIVPPSDEMDRAVHGTNSNLNATDIHMAEEDSSNQPAGTESSTGNQHPLDAPSASTNHFSISTTTTELDKKVQNDVEGDMRNDLRSSNTIAKSLPKHPAVFSIDDIWEKMRPVLEQLTEQPQSHWFRQPVTEAIAPGYFDIIEDPMDFSTIGKKFDENQYTTPYQFCEDMWLVFSNTWTYNKKRTPVYQAARVLATLFMEKADPLMKDYGYCCGRRYASSMRCHASNCRIPPDGDYFVYNNPDRSRTNLLADKYIFCKKCFNSSKSKDMLVGDDSTQIPVKLLKKEFRQAKNDHEEQESMVDCIVCLRRFHEICVLYHESIWPQGYLCKACRRKDNHILARNLPTNNLCRKLEENVNNLLKRECGLDVGRVTIRVLTASDRVCELKPRFKKHVGSQKPNGYPYRTKVIFAFQEIEGVDVVLFGMHVQEYDNRCPGPNAKRVYISYLDSVHYFRPKQKRTALYYEILIGYLEYAKQLGFTYAHIWACPPSEGDDYIFYCHPVDQLIPSSSRLQEWYKTMLDIAVQQRVVVDYKGMMKDCTDSGVSEVMNIPYFEGDFWPDRIEDLLEGFEEKSSSHNVNSDESIESEEPTESSKKRKLDTNSADEKNKKFKKTTSKHSIASLLFDKIKSEMEKQKQSFLVIRLCDNSASDTAPIVDPDPLIPCSLMESRDEFLNFAHNNHCEFSTLRLAKYSTMVLLMELQPSTVYQISYVCDACRQPCDIRYHCKACEDYDLCTKCYHEVKHEHQMERVGEANETIATKSTLSIHTIHHAEQCQNEDCTFDNCAQWKQLIQHLRGCTKRPRTACPLCMKFIAPIWIHAKTCTDQNCRLSRCASFKSQIQQRRIEAGSSSQASASSAITKPV